MEICFWKNLRRGSIATVLLLSIISTSSLLALAATPDKAPAGELTVVGSNSNAEAVVTVDGERSLSGRSVFSAATVVTPSNAGAIISLGKAGRFELSPNTDFTLNFTDQMISGTLTAGKVKVFNSAGVETKIQTKDETLTGDLNQNNLFVVDIRSGVTAAFAETGAISSTNNRKDLNGQDNSTGQATGGSSLSSANVLVPLGIFAGIVAVAVIYVATNNNNDNNVIVSPIR